MFWRFFTFLSFIICSIGVTAPLSEQDLSQQYDKLFDICSQTSCKEYSRYESMNCIHQCISEACYQKHYGKEPLEPGEVDEAREDEYITCVKEEIAQNES
ncbi:uncharacterized protein [Blastocystis hominis]|uniref:Uncharacterized protein n=1 Tax=Blastocystis hominis TaxID=12968 RepID=D8LV78_BLAHO|nr:uncharacterized protein [Blastocystis hominis]CBK19717.2 unnamed protein product [Blastocystis hominis]|eukprot:XP_012893765.1 uncharacterized protein [Blastocystis hominis]